MRAGRGPAVTMRPPLVPQALAQALPSDIDHLNGWIVRRGEALGIATPVNRALWALVKLLEARNA